MPPPPRDEFLAPELEPDDLRALREVVLHQSAHLGPPFPVPGSRRRSQPSIRPRPHRARRPRRPEPEPALHIPPARRFAENRLLDLPLPPTELLDDRSRPEHAVGRQMPVNPVRDQDPELGVVRAPLEQPLRMAARRIVAPRKRAGADPPRRRGRCARRPTRKSGSRPAWCGGARHASCSAPDCHRTVTRARRGCLRTRSRAGNRPRLHPDRAARPGPRPACRPPAARANGSTRRCPPDSPAPPPPAGSTLPSSLVGRPDRHPAPHAAGLHRVVVLRRSPEPRRAKGSLRPLAGVIEPPVLPVEEQMTEIPRAAGCPIAC